MHGFEGPYDVYVGLDVGKRAHHACAVLADGSVAFRTGVDNSEAAIDRVIADAAELGTPLVVVDQRRNIGMLAIRRARAAGVEVAYLPGISANRASALFPGDAKTDARDAEVIARTAMGVPQSLRPVPEEDDLEGARRLEAQRADLIKDRTHQVNRLRSLLLESNPDFEGALEPEATWCVAILERLGGPWNVLDSGRRRFLRAASQAPRERAEAVWRSLGMATRPTERQVEAEMVLVPMLARRIREDTEQIEALEELIDDQVAEDETYRCLLTIPGVARRTATQPVPNVRLADFADHDHLASYCGLAPRNRQSGTSLNSVSSSRQGNKQLKNVLIFSCNSLLRSKGYFREYYDSCRFRGKTHKAAVKATARKRMKVIYAVMRDRVPYREDLLRRQTQ
ncbi:MULTISPECIES: IS110 family transposase [Atopobiaceae]|uniref:Transposase IS116/IS110/IS902 family protein n=1 Tax=Parafannyhessea umbonata TaxID=604330 RepID=A0A1H6KEX2_9ACTN|nr:MULTISPECIES: IS110 family transposase [Atopobiaceae]SEH70043.1 Transposase IS116/IS110/IS902 family protein [Parafannyhessea umbonata]SJZ83086.1 Transposase [Olsenella sp. KH1P3]